MPYVDQYREQAQALGVAKALGPSLEMRARADTLGEALEKLRAAGERERADLVSGVAAGVWAPEEAARRAATVTTWTHGSAASEIIVHAIATAYRDADTLATKAAPAVLADLARMVAGIVARSVTLAATLPPAVRSEHDALRAEVYPAWRSLEQLADAWQRSHALYRVMYCANFVPGPGPADRGAPQDRVIEAWLMFGEPRKLPPGWGGLDPALQLAAAVDAGAGPGMYSWAEAVTHAQAQDPGRRWVARDVAWRLNEAFEEIVPVRNPPAVPTGAVR